VKTSHLQQQTQISSMIHETLSSQEHCPVQASLIKWQWGQHLSMCRSVTTLIWLKTIL